MNKKGFTLVELLAVIIILALLALLASTAITKVVKDSKDDLSNVQISLIKSAAEAWGADHITSLPSDGTCGYITLEKLKNEGLIDSSVVNPANNEEFSNDLKIKISTVSGTAGKPIINYEVNPDSVSGCEQLEGSEQAAGELTLKKGDIITMDLDPNAESETYRVLKVNGTQVEVMSMFDLTTSQQYNERETSNTATFGSTTGQKYAESLLDTYLNTTWYNTLNSAAKAAIVTQNKTQDMWYKNANGDPDYNGTYLNGSTYNYTISKHSETVSIGNRNVYALSVQDVIDYLGVTSSMTNANSTLNPSNIWQMFWNTTSKPSSTNNIWLSSACATNSNWSWLVNPTFGYLGHDNVTLGRAVRVAFVIDLSRVDWS